MLSHVFSNYHESSGGSIIPDVLLDSDDMSEDSRWGHQLRCLPSVFPAFEDRTSGSYSFGDVTVYAGLVAIRVS